MDFYLKDYLLKLFPELGHWNRLDGNTRLGIYTQLNQREKAWVQREVIGNNEEAKKLWESRPCDEPTHHGCPGCGSTPEAIPGGFFVCLNMDCPYVRDSLPDEANPWMGCNHIKASDASCGELRWDSWDW